MGNCRWEENCKNKNECPTPYCKFSNVENADKIFDIIDDYSDLKESIENNKEDVE